MRKGRNPSEDTAHPQKAVHLKKEKPRFLSLGKGCFFKEKVKYNYTLGRTYMRDCNRVWGSW